MLVKGGVGTLLVGGGHELMALVLDPLSDAKLVLCAAEQLWLVLGVLASLIAISCQLWFIDGLRATTDAT